MSDGGSRRRAKPPPAARADRATTTASFDFRAERLRVRHPGGGRDAPSVLNDLSLAIRHGEQVAVIGASGAGKSTLLATLALAREPHAGTLEVFGRTAWSMTSGERHRLRRLLFLAPQTPPLPPRQRVVDAVLAGRLPRWSLAKALASLVHPDDPGAARAALARFALDDKLFARVDRLSGGERQRVALARMLVADVDAMLVDEPLSALDPALAERSIAVLQDAARQRDATLVCSLHQVDVALARFPRIVGLREGSVLFDLPSADVGRALLDRLYAGTALSAAASTSGVDDAAASLDDRDGDVPLRIADGSRL